MNGRVFNLQTIWRLIVVSNGTSFCSALSSNFAPSDDVPSFFAPVFFSVRTSGVCLHRQTVFFLLSFIFPVTKGCRRRAKLSNIPSFILPRVRFHGCLLPVTSTTRGVKHIINDFVIFFCVHLFSLSAVCLFFSFQPIWLHRILHICNWRKDGYDIIWCFLSHFFFSPFEIQSGVTYNTLIDLCEVGYKKTLKMKTKYLTKNICAKMQHKLIR